MLFDRLQEIDSESELSASAFGTVAASNLSPNDFRLSLTGYSNSTLLWVALLSGWTSFKEFLKFVIGGASGGSVYCEFMAGGGIKSCWYWGSSSPLKVALLDFILTGVLTSCPPVLFLDTICNSLLMVFYTSVIVSVSPSPTTETFWVQLAGIISFYVSRLPTREVIYLWSLFTLPCLFFLIGGFFLHFFSFSTWSEPFSSPDPSPSSSSSSSFSLICLPPISSY